MEAHIECYAIGAFRPSYLHVKKSEKKATKEKRQVETLNPSPSSTQSEMNVLGHTWNSGPYIFIIEVKLAQGQKLPANKQASLVLDVEFKNEEGYLSAIDKPFLKFYTIMCLLYSGYAVVWSLFCFLHWRDLLRLQYWICAVIALGLIEKSVFLAEYIHMNNYGVVLRGVELFAELVSVFKRTLARVLVIIVSLGFGIVKPRLGDVMRKVLFVGLLFFVLASFEAVLRVCKVRDSRSMSELLAFAPLSITDAVISFWIMTSLLETLKNLKLRRNIVKLSLYRHFFNTLAFCVVAALVYLVWSVITHQVSN